MAIIKQKDRKTGTIYVYEQKSKWIPELHQPRAKRRLIGKLDDEGNIIATGPVGRPKKDGSSANPKSTETHDTTSRLSSALQKKIDSLEKRVTELESERNDLKARITKAAHILSDN